MTLQSVKKIIYKSEFLSFFLYCQTEISELEWEREGKRLRKGERERVKDFKNNGFLRFLTRSRSTVNALMEGTLEMILVFGQCDRMLEWKVDQFVSKVDYIVVTTYLA